MAGLVHAVVGAAGALQQPRCPLGRPHLDDEVDIAPIDAEIEAGGGDDGAQPAGGHGVLGLAPRLRRQRSVVDADRQRLVILGPQVAKDDLRDRPRVDEDDGQPRLFDAAHDGARRPAAIVPGPGDAVFGHDDLHHRRCARIAAHEGHAGCIGIWGEPALIGLRVGDGGAQPDAAQAGGEPLQPRQRQAELVAALGGGKGVDFIDDDGLHAGQHRRRIGIGNQQRQRFGRRQQDMRRAFTLPLLAVRRGIAGARLDADIKADLGDGRQQVALHIDGERLQRRDIDGVQAIARIVGQIGQRGEKPRQRLARSRRRHQQRMIAGPRRRDHFELVPPRRPATLREPVGDGGGEGHCADIGEAAPKCTRSQVAGTA